MKYEYGKEYECNGVKPDLPDDVEIEQFSTADYKWHAGTVSLYNWAARTIIKFRIVDERYNSASAQGCYDYDDKQERDDLIKQAHETLGVSPTTATEEWIGILVDAGWRPQEQKK